MQLEGVIAKRADSPYASRAHAQLAQAQVQAASGVRGRAATRTAATIAAQIGSLLLGVYDATGQPRIRRQCRDGLGYRDARMLKEKLARLDIPEPPFTGRRQSRADGREAPRGATAGSSRNWWPKWSTPR